MISGSRIERIKAELLDRYSIKKCNIEITEGTIECDSSLAISKAGNVTFKYPNTSRLVEDNPPNTDVMIVSDTGMKYYIGIGIDGLLYTYPTLENEQVKINTHIQITDEGILFTENITTGSVEFELIDLNGYTWIVGIENTGLIYTEQSGMDRKVYYRKEQVEINYLTDKLKIWYGIDDQWYSLGEYMMTSPKQKNGLITTQLMDLTVLIQKRRELEPVVFTKGTPYHEVLSYFIIKSGYIKINIEATHLVLQSDRVFDDSKNRLEWFNEVAKEINYTNLSVDEQGYFISKRYRQPTLSSVTQVYRTDQASIISGEIDIEQDFWNTYNVIKCVHSNPDTPLLISIARNDDPSDPFSTYAIGEVPLTIKVDNVADKQELDSIATKTLFEYRQTTQDVLFHTLINPTHKLNDVIQLFSPSLSGVFLESKWTIPLKAGGLMSHKMKRLVDVRSVVK